MTSFFRNFDIMGATDSKLAFRKGVFRLFEERNVPVNALEYWSLFWTLPETADDVFSLIGANDIRRARDSARENLETLIDKIMEHMDTLVHAPDFPSAQHSVTSLLNCCRVLTRIVPYIFESTECTEWEEKFFWVPRSVKRAPSTVTGESQEGTANDQKEQYDILPPRAEILIALTLRCLFLAGFTLPHNMGTADSHVNYVIWETGVGSSTPIGSFRDNDIHRTEVLRLLVVLLSRSMYISPTHILSTEDRWLHFIVTKTERKIVLALLCSLLNTACKYNPLGWGVPYNHVMFTDTREQLVAVSLRVLLVILDYHSSRAAISMRALDQRQGDTSCLEIVSGIEVLSLDESQQVSELHSSSASSVANSSTHSPSAEELSRDINNPNDNIFKHYLSKLHRAQDFQFLSDGIYRILSNPMQANASYLPGSTKRVRCHVEMMMLFWKLLETNNRFRTYLVETERVLDLMVVLIFHAMESKMNAAQVGLVRMCAFLLQSLSADRTFAVKLNRPFENHSSLPASIRIPNFRGTYADFFIISIFTLIASSRGSLSTLYPALVLTVSNVSPYLKGLSVTTATKLMSLFGSISAPGFLLADEVNHRLVKYLLEALNCIIQYQSSDNVNLIYAIVRNHSKFEKLASLTLKDAVDEIERVRQLKQEKLLALQQQQQAAAAVKHGKGPATEDQDAPTTPGAEARIYSEPGEAEGLSEKARGKLPEGVSPPLSRTSSTASVRSHTGMPPRQSSVSSTLSAGSLLPGAKHGFTPTEEWMEGWHSQLPLETILALLDYLRPQVEALCAEDSAASEPQVLEFLRGVTLVGVLPPPQPIVIRKFQWGEALVIWFRSMLWGQAYVVSISNYSPWKGTHVKLFQIKQQPSHPPPESPRPPSVTA